MTEAKKNFHLGQEVEVIIPTIRAIQVNFITLLYCLVPYNLGNKAESMENVLMIEEGHLHEKELERRSP
jgi:hypothetical protein